MTSKFEMLLFAVLGAAVLFHQCHGYAMKRDDVVEDEDGGTSPIIVVQAVQELLEEVKDGITAVELKDALDGIIAAVTGVLADADADVSEEDAQDVIESILDMIYSDEEEPVKASFDDLNRGFLILSGLADAVAGILDGGETEGLDETLLAIKITASSLIDSIDDIGDALVFSFNPDAADGGSDGDGGDNDDGNDVADDGDGNDDDGATGGDDGDDGGAADGNDDDSGAAVSEGVDQAADVVDADA